MPHRVSVDKAACLSTGRCVADRPEAFRFDDDELAEPVSPVPSLPADELVAIARGCPSGAITVYDDRGEALDLD